MNFLLYYFTSAVFFLIRILPLDTVARLGRLGGEIFYFLDARHRRVACRNLAAAFPEKSAAEVRALAKENFRRIGENFVCPVKMAYLTDAERLARVEFGNLDHILKRATSEPRRNIIVAIGHFGNFELFAHIAKQIPSHQAATTYRAIRNPAADRILQQLRNSSGCRYFERRSEGAALRSALRENDLILGLLSDQHSGDSGLRLPFLGRDCNTSKAPAVFALRFEAPLFTGISYRTSLAHWQVEVGDEIPTQENGQPRSPADIMLDVNRAFEVAVRRDPANWFWVHNRWKPAKNKSAAMKSDVGETGMADDSLQRPISSAADANSPSPRGDGRGEGKGDARTPARSDSSKDTPP